MINEPSIISKIENLQLNIGNGVVILDHELYNNAIQEIVSDGCEA